MNEVNNYLNNLAEDKREKFQEVIEYIRSKYPEVQESCDYAPKTKFPVFKKPESNIYVGIVERKGYISIHFGNYGCTEIVAKVNPKIKVGVGCAKIPDKIEFPIEEIKQAINQCFA